MAVERHGLRARSRSCAWRRAGRARCRGRRRRAGRRRARCSRSASAERSSCRNRSVRKGRRLRRLTLRSSRSTRGEGTVALRHPRRDDRRPGVIIVHAAIACRAGGPARNPPRHEPSGG
jgi:hypothetical protein